MCGDFLNESSPNQTGAHLEWGSSHSSRPEDGSAKRTLLQAAGLQNRSIVDSLASLDASTGTRGTGAIAMASNFSAFCLGFPESFEWIQRFTCQVMEVQGNLSKEERAQALKVLATPGLKHNAKARDGI